MRTIREAVLSAAKLAGFSAIALDAESARALAGEVGRKFASPAGCGAFMWERFAPSYSVRDPDGWKWIGALVDRKPLTLLFMEDEQWQAVELPGGVELTTCLRECPGFEFFVVDQSLDFVLCFNHHDHVVAAGTAVPLLRGRAAAMGSE